MKDYYTTEDVNDLIHELTMALWDWEKRADKNEAVHMNARLGLLRAYAKCDVKQPWFDAQAIKLAGL